MTSYDLALCLLAAEKLRVESALASTRKMATAIGVPLLWLACVGCSSEERYDFAEKETGLCRDTLLIQYSAHNVRCPHAAHHMNVGPWLPTGFRDVECLCDWRIQPDGGSK